VTYEQGASKTVDGKYHQPLEAPRPVSRLLGRGMVACGRPRARRSGARPPTSILRSLPAPTSPSGNRTLLCHEVVGSAGRWLTWPAPRNYAVLPVWVLCFLSLGPVSETCYFEPNIRSSEPMWQFCFYRGSKMSKGTSSDLNSDPYLHGEFLSP
jgi:hypothetical protein